MIGRRLDFRTVVTDPRPAFATRKRVPEVDELIVSWPDDVLVPLLTSDGAVIVVSHDAKIDLPALRWGLASNVSYIELLGSRRSQRVRFDALRSEGFRDDAVARIHEPAGRLRSRWKHQFANSIVDL